ncbi:MAG: YIP1 family protein [Bryobacterales bacterium]|nr:YIP1 family protein [Bryobacterales bacterium]MBV9396635.1 YIP1 family protein [Bryobacterales bacterium]
MALQPQIPDPIPPPMPPPLSAPEEKLNELQRILGVFFSPAKAFVDIARRPRWWIPILLIGIASSIYLNAYSQRVGFERLIRQTLDQSSRADNMTAQQRQQAIAVGASVARIVAYGGAIVTSVIGVFLTAAVMIFIANNLMGGKIRFNSMMGIVSYAFLPQLLVVALSMLVLYLKAPDDFDLRNPLLFNAAAFVPAGSAQWIKSLASSFDLFSFWIMGLIACGISAASPKIKTIKAFGGVLFAWALFVALRTAYVAAFG